MQRTGHGVAAATPRARPTHAVQERAGTLADPALRQGGVPMAAA